MGGLLVPVSTTVIHRVEGTLAQFVPPGCVLVAGWSAEVITSAPKRSIGFTIGFHNHGEGPY